MSTAASPSTPSSPWKQPQDQRPPAHFHLIRRIGHDAAAVNTWLGHHRALVWVAVIAALAIAYIVVGVWRHRGPNARIPLLRTRRSPGAQRRNAAPKLGPKLGWKDAQRFIQRWPRDPTIPGSRIVLRYAPSFIVTDPALKAVEDVITSLAGGEWDITHHGLHNRLVCVRRAAPRTMPDRVTYQWNDNDRADLIPFGVDAEGTTIHADLSGRTPHVLLSAATGFGKTTTLRSMIAHVTGHGGLVDIIDPKHQGFLAAFDGLHNIRIHTEYPDMLDTIRGYREEIDDVYRDMKKRRIDERDDDAPIRVLVIDEVSTFSEMARAEWRAREDARGAVPDIFGDLQRILWLGRAARCHVFVAAQQANAKALFGSSDPRDQFSLKIAIGPQSVEAWGVMFGRDQTRPDAEGERGLAYVGIGTAFRQVRIATISNAEARKTATRGDAAFPTKPVDASTPVGHTGHVVTLEKPAPAPTYTPKTTFPTLTAVPDIPEPTQPTPARATPIPARGRPGRPADRPPVTLACGNPKCGRTWETRAVEGGSVPCPGCKRRRRVPVGARSGGGG